MTTGQNAPIYRPPAGRADSGMGRPVGPASDANPLRDRRAISRSPCSSRLDGGLCRDNLVTRLSAEPKPLIDYTVR